MTVELKLCSGNKDTIIENGMGRLVVGYRKGMPFMVCLLFDLTFENFDFVFVSMFQ